MSNDFLFGDKTLIFIFMYKYNNIRLIYVNYKSLNNELKSALVINLNLRLCFALLAEGVVGFVFIWLGVPLSENRHLIIHRIAFYQHS